MVRVEGYMKPLAHVLGVIALYGALCFYCMAAFASFATLSDELTTIPDPALVKLQVSNGQCGKTCPLPQPEV